MDGVLLNQELVFRVIDLTGVFCGGCLGGTVARRHKFDFVGFLILGIRQLSVAVYYVTSC